MPFSTPPAAVAAAQTITLTGDVTGSGTTSIASTLATVATAGTYQSVTVNAKGLVTAGGTLTSGQITAALGYTPANEAGDSFSGAVTLNAGGAIAAGQTLTNNGAMNGGTVSPATLIFGNATAEITTSNTTDSGGNQIVPLTASGSASQISVRLVTKSGYVCFADSGTTAPNACGADAVDLQLARSAAAQVASGTDAFAAGAHNTASGTRATAIGYANTASGQGSVALGQSANDNGANATIAFAGGNTGQQVDQQLSATTSSGGSARLTSDGNAAGAHNVLNIPNNTVAGGRLIVTARNPSDGTGAMWDLDVLYWAASSAITVQQPGTATIAPGYNSSSLATATIAVSADTTNLGLNVTYQSPTGVSSHVSARFVAQQQT